MSTYRPPVEDMMFTLRHVVGIDVLPHMHAGDLDFETIEAILEEASKLAADVLAPLNREGDRYGCVYENGNVMTPPGFKEAYIQYRNHGWNGVPFDPDYGGQGLPWAVAFAVQEMWQGANLSFGLCPLLNQAAVEAIAHHGNEEQKRYYLEKLVSGEWTGTMNLTEPQAGSDLAAIKAMAEPQEDGTYRLKGQKIFITYGEHDFAENIIHMVLARTPGAPDGVKGISLFLVPKFIPDYEGNPATRNDVTCVSIEHKLGIHASPTCTMQYGDQEGAVAWLIGQEGEGLKYMFTMMNNARLSVGLQGVALAEHAYQHASSYAQERIQGFALGDKSGERVAIIEHPDVKRMLMSMKAQVCAGRALAYEAAASMDLARTGDEKARARVELLTPIVKAWCTDMAVRVASEGLQVHGGMGFIEETGAAQFYRDARILPIYEGTNAIQANDMIFRKTLMTKGALAAQWFEEAEGYIKAAAGYEALALLARKMEEVLSVLKEKTKWLVQEGEKNPEFAAAVSVPYLCAFGHAAASLMLLRGAEKEQALASGSERLLLAKFYTYYILPQALSSLACVSEEGASAPLS